MDNIHTGVRCYMHWKNGWPAIYLTMNEMPAEEGLILEYCLSREAKGENSDAIISATLAAVAEDVDRLSRYG